MIIKRSLSLNSLLKKKSFFLFGPRATGKTTLIKQCFAEDEMIFINLLRGDIYLRLHSAPHELEEMLSVTGDSRIMVIDEIQRVPHRLNRWYGAYLPLAVF